MLIRTSKTQEKVQRSIQAENVRKFGNTSYSPEARRQYSRVSKGNREEYRNEKRMLELHQKGFNEAAIAGMMFGEKNTTTNEAKVKSVIRKQKGKIKTDGNV